MPELPEVQTVVNDLNNVVIGKEISSLEELYPNTIRYSSDEKDYLSSIKKVYRRGKYIVFSLKTDFSIIVHLRMTGKLIYEVGNKETLKHERARITFSDNSFLRFDDVRTFGTIDCLSNDNLSSYFQNLGKEPLDDSFGTEYFTKICLASNSPIKTLLLDQRKIAGLGNIYACEILYRSKIHPLTPAKTLTNKMIKNILYQIKEVLNEAIACNGTTISDYRRVDDKSGTFQNFLQIYGKKLCPLNHQVDKIKIGGRSTYFCKICQSNIFR